MAETDYSQQSDDGWFESQHHIDLPKAKQSDVPSREEMLAAATTSHLQASTAVESALPRAYDRMVFRAQGSLIVGKQIADRFWGQLTTEEQYSIKPNVALTLQSRHQDDGSVSVKLLLPMGAKGKETDYDGDSLSLDVPSDYWKSVQERRLPNPSVKSAVRS